MSNSSSSPKYPVSHREQAPFVSDQEHGLAIVVGEVLWDCFESHQKGSESPTASESRQTNRVLGGAPLNVAWNLAGFGLDPLFISAVGDDELGHEILDRMMRWGMNTDGVTMLPDVPTGSVQITLVDGEPQYEIVGGVAYDQIPVPPAEVLEAITQKITEIASKDRPAILYHGTLAYRGQGTRNSLHHLLHTLDAKVFFDINVRQPHFDANWLDELVPTASTIKLNQDELELVAGSSVNEPGQREQAARNLLANHESLNTLLVTLGAQGAECYLSDQDTPIRVTAPKPAEMVDAVGAGDAFASVMIHAIVTGRPLGDAMLDAVAFAAKVCGLAGATSDQVDFYRLAGFSTS